MLSLCLSTLTPDTPVTIDMSDESLTLSVNDVLKWIAPAAPRQEALRFLLICRSARVNPFLKEAHLVPRGDSWVVIIDKSGWLRRAEEHPAFDGHESGIIVRRVNPGVNESGDPYDIEGTCLPPGHAVTGGWARVYRKDRRYPTVAKVSLIEYLQDSPTWKRLTSTMICKTALVHALRESGLCFGLSGAYDRDEMPPVAPQVDPGPISEEVEVEYRSTPMPSLSLILGIELVQAIRDLGMTDYQVATMLTKRGVQTVAELTDSQARDLIHKLHGLIDQANAGKTFLPDGQTEDEEESEARASYRKSDEVVVDADAVVAEALAGLAEGEIADELGDEDGQPAPPAVATDFGIPETTDDSEVADVERPLANAPVKRSRKKVATA